MESEYPLAATWSSPLQREEPTAESSRSQPGAPPPPGDKSPAPGLSSLRPPGRTRPPSLPCPATKAASPDLPCLRRRLCLDLTGKPKPGPRGPAPTQPPFNTARISAWTKLTKVRTVFEARRQVPGWERELRKEPHPFQFLGV